MPGGLPPKSSGLTYPNGGFLSLPLNIGEAVGNFQNPAKGVIIGVNQGLSGWVIPQPAWDVRYGPKLFNAPVAPWGEDPGQVQSEMQNPTAYQIPAGSQPIVNGVVAGPPVGGLGVVGQSGPTTMVGLGGLFGLGTAGQTGAAPTNAPPTGLLGGFDIGSMMSLFMQIEQLKMMMSLFQGL